MLIFHFNGIETEVSSNSATKALHFPSSITSTRAWVQNVGKFIITFIIDQRVSQSFNLFVIGFNFSTKELDDFFDSVI